MATYTVDYLIIGNSAAGVNAAQHIRKVDAQGSVLMLSKEPYPAYGTPLISYMIEGKTTEDKVWFKDPEFYTRNNLQTLFGPEYEAVKLRSADHEVDLKNGETVAYGKVLLACGSVPFTPPFKGYNAQENTHNFMTLDDAKEAWADVEAATAAAHAQGRESHVVVIGGGLIGLKAAEALSHHADHIDVYELAPRILPAVLDAQGASVLQKMLEAHGVMCHPGLSADEFFSEGNRITKAHINDGTTVDVDVLMLCVGVRPNSALAVEDGAEQGRGLIVGTDMQTTLPDVYAAGDLVQITDSLDGAQRPLALWPIALEHGQIAGYNMACAPNAPQFEGSFAINAVDFYEASLLTSGLINPAEDSGCEQQIFCEGNQYVKIVTRGDYLVGYILLNRPEQAGIYSSIIRNQVPLSSFQGDIFQVAPENIAFDQQRRWERLHAGYPSQLDQLGWKERA
ncbi:MAG: FAD-dependent oxidoreductase [Coriobacteriia bacterium]|nr:FAD-dependent oxidoreductase [Coriobacteriia bacterium]